MPEARELTFSAAIHEAIGIAMAADDGVFVMGEGVADPKAIFGTLAGMPERFGKHRVMETPLSENAMTGVALGASQLARRPILVHQRVDFALLSLDQIINNAAKWHYMYGGIYTAPIVIRLVIGRGWGQGAQHAQSLESVFAHIPGLKVVMPACPHDAKGLMIAAIEDNNPVIYLEHRWLHGTRGPVPEGHYATPIEAPRIARKGDTVTIAATSYMVVEALKAAEMLQRFGCSAEVIDLRVLRPFNPELVLQSVRKTGHLITVDTGWGRYGIGAEVVACVAEGALSALAKAPVRMSSADHPSPSSPGLIQGYYPSAEAIVGHVFQMELISKDAYEGSLSALREQRGALPLDVPDPKFTGPF